MSATDTVITAVDSDGDLMVIRLVESISIEHYSKLVGFAERLGYTVTAHKEMRGPISLVLEDLEGEVKALDQYCPHSGDHVHQMDRSIAEACDDVPPAAGENAVLVDVACSACGRSGALHITPEQVDW